MSKFKITVTTKSNLFIGGNPTMFEIGGVDQYTIVDTDQRPYIPASTLKGVFRQCLKGSARRHIFRISRRSKNPQIRALILQTNSRITKKRRKSFSSMPKNNFPYG